MDRTLIKDTINKVGETVLLKGWVNSRRDHGKIVFLDLRDRWGTVQVVATDIIAGKINSEWVVAVTGKVKQRPSHLANPNIATGTIEIEAEEIRILAESETLPFPIDTDGYEIEEETRLKFRYVDLRRKRLRRNLAFRNQVIWHIRQWLLNRDFWEIETPIITKATPEGARDFLVPSRLQPGNFYALPQSPQQYKQLLMVAGVERYFQIARCFRDEDPRADRAYGEFTQLDLELSFTTQEEIRALTEELFIHLVKELLPDKHINQVPFPVITYKEAMEKYGSDKPDFRKDKTDPNELAFGWIVDFPLFEWKEQEGRWDATHHPFTSPKSQFIDEIKKADPKNPKEKIFKEATADQYDFVLNGYEIGGGSIRITDPDLQSKIFEIMGHIKEQIHNKFGHLIKAFTLGVPPHGGIAPGIDRFIMAALGEPNIREVMAFPASASGHTSVMNAPSEVDQQQLDELGICIAEQQNVFERIKKFLDKNSIEYRSLEHEAAHTSEESAKIRGTKLEQGAKALVMFADSKPLMLVLPANLVVDTGAFKKSYSVKDLRMATPAEVKKLTRTEIGAVPPFGNLFNLPLYVDKKLGENYEIAFNAGEHTKSIIMKYSDFEQITKPVVGNFTSAR